MVVVLFLSLHLAVSYEHVKDKPLVKDMMFENNTIVQKEYFNTPALIADFGDRLDKHIGEIEFNKSTPKFLLGGLFVCLLVGAYIITTRKKFITGSEYGTSKWAKIDCIKHLFSENAMKSEIAAVKKRTGLSESQITEKIEAIKAKYEDADMLLTKTERICMYNYELNNNTLIVGGAGSGKTRGYVLPNILQANASYIITDPKGEILEKIGYFLEHVKGYKIRVLNLDEKKLSNGYNPFHYIHRERDGWEERVLSLIETVIINTDGGVKKTGTDPFWDKAERLFLQSVFFAVAEAFPPIQSNMNTVMELIRWLKISEEGDNYDSDLDLFFQCFEAKYGADHIAVQQFKEFREKASGKTAKSIVISAVARLAPFNIKEVRRISTHDDMYLDMVGEEKTAIFVVVPPIDKTYNFIAGMLFTQLFQELNYCALNVHKHDGQRLPISCRFILDEFANTCEIPNFVSILAYARSLGIGITPILQSLEQIKNMYKDEWGVIIDNCDTLLYLGKVKHMETLKYISELLGKGTFDKRSTSVTRGRQSSSSISDDKFGRELMDASEVRKLKSKKCLLFVSSQDPFYSTKYEYKKHKNYIYTSDKNAKYSYHYKPTPPPIIEADSPHGEEMAAEYKPPILTFKKLEVEFGQNHIAEFLSGHVLNSDFDPDESLIVNDGEREELLLYAQLDKEEEDISATMESILSNVIDFKSDPLSFAEASLSLMEAETLSPGCIDFDDVEVNDGEPSIEDEYLFDAEGETGALNLVLADAETLLADMSEDMGSFMEKLGSIDMSALGEVSETA